jgi:D-alanyl-D-alanine carboxypeptidase
VTVLKLLATPLLGPRPAFAISRRLLLVCLVALTLTLIATMAKAAPYAAMVMDARSGEIYHSRNANSRLHPASLTKMMTLYLAFEAVQNGEITMDTKVTISRNAAAEPPSKLGLRSGQKIALRYLVRAAAVKSANDAATAIGEAISGSEAAFAERMNRTAKAIGMKNTTFKNAHGLTRAGHMSTAHDMTILGRQLFFDYPEYYNLFSRTTANAGVKRVNHTNSRFLNSYRGADGIKTGYTRAAGFNLTASARRGQERIIVTVFGGRSTASRNAKVSELMNLGFNRAPSRVATVKPRKPNYTSSRTGILTTSLRPKSRPGASIDAAVYAALEEDYLGEGSRPDAGEIASIRPALRPSNLKIPVDAFGVPNSPQGVVERVEVASGSWGINVGLFGSAYHAERALLTTALSEAAVLTDATRRVVRGRLGFDANFTGLSRESAALACRRLKAKRKDCEVISPS